MAAHDTETFGALLRRYRGATPGSARRRWPSGRGDRAGQSVPGARAACPPDTLARLAAALALTPAQHGALVRAAARAGTGDSRTPDVERDARRARVHCHPGRRWSGGSRNWRHLRGGLAASLGGQGGLVLSAERRASARPRWRRRCLRGGNRGRWSLVGRCYDLTETPPYGLWTEARSQFPPRPISALPLRPAHRRAKPRQFFAEVRAFFAAAAAQQPLVLLLEDLQWADPAQLDLLRFLARSLATLPLLLVVNYRPDDLDHRHPFAQLIPLLVREARAERLRPRAALRAALHTLVRSALSPRRSG